MFALGTSPAWLPLLLLPVVGAGIGWFTNVVAIWMLFWPRQPVRIPLAGLVLQGVFPRRRQELARSIARVVEEQLFSVEELIASVDGAGYRREAVSAIASHVERRLQESLPRWLPEGLRDGIAGYFVDVTRREAGQLIDGLADRVEESIRQNSRIGERIEQKVLALDLAELERLLVQVVGRELRWVERLGAVLGFVIGLVQMGLAWFAARLAAG